MKSSVNSSNIASAFGTAGLRSRVRAYKKRMLAMNGFLEKHPEEWGRFQSEFNQEINGIFRDLMNFEKDNLMRGQEVKVYKLKKMFVDWFRKDFVKGDYLERSLNKPYGYAGDFQIIDDIYLNAPNSTGFARLYDNYFQMSTICNAVRNRKEDFKQIMLEYIETHYGPNKNPIKVMSLASGPCRDIFEIFSHPILKDKNIIFHCYDNDEKAIDYAQQRLKNDPRVIFFKLNAVRMALKKDALVSDRYDLIYSTGLFDYFDNRISVRLIANLKKLLNPGGLLAISDVRDKFSNPSLYFMEWVADWNLVYRDDDSFRGIFIEAGFREKDLNFRYEQQGVMQYILATKIDA